MKAMAFTLLALLVACSPNDSYKSHLTTRPDSEMSDTYTISCEGPTGWTNYQTKRHPSNCYGGRSGIWSFLTVEGLSVWKTNCSVEINAK